ncbi:MAG: hypothetical protein ACTSPW_09510 [Promethearchaeota archaeon]
MVGNRLELKEVSLRTLFSHASSALRAGSTSDIKDRWKNYKEKYRGIMYYTRVDNMEEYENRLLKNYEFPDNYQRESNASSEPGYVYIIKGIRI